MLNIDQPDQSKMPPILMLGFRPFFLAGSIFAVITMLAWMAVFSFGQVSLYPSWVNIIPWHAHEMMFGYIFAIIAGFLLTAVKNWTGQSPAEGGMLAGVFSVWLLARILPYFDAVPISLIAIIDSIFMLWVAVLITIPLYKAKQFKQYGIVAKLIMLAGCNVLFYLGVLGILADGIQWGLYSALYVILALVFVMMRRLVPFFTEKGLRVETAIANSKFIDHASLVLFLLYWIFDVFITQESIMLFLSISLFSIHAVRLKMWYRKEIWTKSLLWVLHVAYFMMTIAFALKAASILFDISPYLAIHAFMVGGVGVLTIGMVSRVSLGHTGRDIFNPPNILHLIFALITLSAVVRVFFPMLWVSNYATWVIISQGLWASSFALFVFVYAPYFVQKRVDGRFG